MSAPCTILASLPSFCQKLSNLVDIKRSSDKNNFAQYFLRHGVYCNINELEMWANAQRDGRAAEYRWRPLFNAAKFG